MTQSTGSGWGESLRTVIYAVLLALALRTFAYEPFSIPSKSMVPTLLVGDYLFVSKFSYGYSRYSFPFGLPLFEGRVLGSIEDVERGDVAVFKKPTDNKTDYIKRIVGLPGDEIQVVDGILQVNGVAVEREALGSGSIAEAGYRTDVTEYTETLPNGRQHLIWEERDDAYLDDTEVFTVPAGQFFAMGDNRDASQDSRVQSAVGFVPFENLVGRAEFIFFSHRQSAELWEVWKWPQNIRWGRLFDGID
ncbi:MAG: signal peptidase I [Rhodovibrionaceae bacterium]